MSLQRFLQEDYEFYKDQALNNDKVRAIGEIGLDYYYDFSDRETQRSHLFVSWN